MKEIQSTHNIDGIIATDEWYTPKEFLEKLGEFDTDPCVPIKPLYQTAKIMYNKEQDGLKQEWEGRVWLNPPYSAPLITEFMKKMAKHKNGIALLMPKFGSVMFREHVYPFCDGIFILNKRIKFYDYNHIQQKSPVSTSILIAYGQENINSILNSGLEGTMLYTKR